MLKTFSEVRKMSDKLLVAMLKAKSSGPEDEPIIKTFQGAERDKMVRANFENLLEVMCKGGDFSESQQQIAQYVKKGIGYSKANNYKGYQGQYLHLDVLDADEQPKPRIDEKGNLWDFSGLTVEDIAGKYILDILGKYIDERIWKGDNDKYATKFDCIDIKAEIICVFD